MFKKEITKKEIEKDSLNKKMKLLRIVIVNTGFKKKK
jgi:hypothetical protein